jgi:hypothetical protein
VTELQMIAEIRGTKVCVVCGRNEARVLQ